MPDSKNAPLTRWNRFENEPPSETPVEFKHAGDESFSKTDMTPMVDVTFLLLIFFMITASFTVIRSVQHPAPRTDQHSRQTQPIIDETEYVECIVDQYDTFQITSRDSERIEAASELEMRRALKQAIDDHSPQRLVITTHNKSSLKKMMAVYSAGRLFGIANIQHKTTGQDF